MMIQLINQEEVITTVTTTLTAGSQSDHDIKGPDGDGPNVPVVTVSGDLLVNTTYSGRLVSNESVTSDDITVEVKEEGAEHQVFFRLWKQLSLYLLDADVNGKPIGLALL
jgi:hypothetical protein